MGPTQSSETPTPSSRCLVKEYPTQFFFGFNPESPKRKKWRPKKRKKGLSNLPAKRRRTARKAGSPLHVDLRNGREATGSGVSAYSTGLRDERLDCRHERSLGKIREASTEAREQDSGEIQEVHRRIGLSQSGCLQIRTQDIRRRTRLEIHIGRQRQRG